MKRSGIKHKPTKRGKQAQQAIDAFRAEHCAPGKRCWLCGARQADHPHHIVYRRGDEYDVPENLLATCEKLCHPLLHGTTVVLDGVRYEGWEKEEAYIIAMSAKLNYDPDNYDPEFLDRLAHPERTLKEFFSVKEMQ